MTITVANTANTNTFEYWRQRTNELADAMSTKVVTVDSNTATGNAAISNKFTANGIVANSYLRGGNSTTNGVLYISTNTSIGVGNTLTVGNTVNNTYVTYNYISVGNSSVNTQIYGGNLYLNGFILTVGTAGSNVTINSSSISINGVSFSNEILSLGNSSVNSTINSTSIAFNSSLFANSTTISPPTSSVFTIDSTAALKIPVGITANRPTGQVGLFRYNSSISKYEIYIDSSWQNVAIESTQLKIYNVSNTQIFP